MDQIDENLKPADDCERALEAQTRQLDGQVLSPADAQQLQAHLAACSICASEIPALNTLLVRSVEQVRVSPGFAARVMKSLPASTPKVTPSSQELPRVFAPQPKPRWWLAGAAAAAVALVAIGAMLFAPSTTQVAKSGPLILRKGILIDSNGKVVTRVQSGATYTAQETAVLPMTEQSAVKIERGSRIMVSGPENNPGVELENGDLYAWTRDEQRPLRVSSASFHTEFFGGDFFVAETGADDNDPRSVVIVFTGRAEVMPRDGEVEAPAPLALRAGQVFMRLGEFNITQTLELSEAVVRMQHEPAPRVDMATLRRDYEKRILGYQADLKSLETMLRTEKDAQRLSELRARKQLVLSYCEAHQRELETLVPAMPFEQIERGVRGRSDPIGWM